MAENGFLYVTDGWGSVYKIDAHGGQGKLLWKMDPKTDHDWAGAIACCGVDNRGAALWKGTRDLAHARRAANRDEQGDRRDRLAARGRQPGSWRGRDRRAADCQGHGDHRRGRRRIRHPRLDRSDRSQHAQGDLAHLHDPGQGRARDRNLEGQQRRGRDRRRLHLGHRQLRPGHRHHRLGRRQSGTGLGQRIPSRRQPLHRQLARPGCQYRQDEVVFPAHAERPV